MLHSCRPLITLLVLLSIINNFVHNVLYKCYTWLIDVEEEEENYCI